MRILLTGGAGLLGSHVLEKLINVNAIVVAPTRRELDLTDSTKTLEYMDSQEISHVIHCAARVGGIEDNISHPADFILENLRIDASVLHAARSLKIQKLIYFGSSCMYPVLAPQPFKELSIMSGSLEPTNESYAIAKVAGTNAVASISKQDSLNWSTLVLSNIYGPRDNFAEKNSHLLASIIRKMYAAKLAKMTNVSIWGDGTARREFTYVSDVADFVVNFINDPNNSPQTLNLGIGTDYSVMEYYQEVAEVLQYNPTFAFDSSKPSGMKEKLMDSSIAQRFGWNPPTNLRIGIEKTIDWYVKNEAK
jgi:GDP-L-fucose synthase